jgi:hypothetical protein
MVKVLYCVLQQNDQIDFWAYVTRCMVAGIPTSLIPGFSVEPLSKETDSHPANPGQTPHTVVSRSKSMNRSCVYIFKSKSLSITISRLWLSITTLTVSDRPNRLLLHPSESFADLLVYSLEFTRYVFLRLCVWRFKLHLRKLVYNVGGFITDLTKVNTLYIRKQKSIPWQMSYRCASPQLVAKHRRTQRNISTFQQSCRMDSIGHIRKYRFVAGSHPKVFGQLQPGRRE